ncbi:hypothetical protein HPB52_004950 [Rhipicephalus sanguineus]|uniref:Uncharacterized protein n=1 Tax=Rhipicephalus sanguineus TaxID=34632 RepID=A0A9D4SN30_RHISA|nr:hypothetical protein HPB52_004950 [Rhipicephalus sanguineus]
MSPAFTVSVDQLICTVGDTAIFDRMVPLDGLCHYIYYTNIVVQKGELTAIKVSVSWNTFKAVLSGYKKTTGGIGFDVRYVDVTDLSAQVQGKLNDLYLRNVKHYGILNALETSKNLTDIFTKAKGLLKKLKNFQVRDDTQKTLLAFGIYNYLEDGAWDTLQEVFASAVNDSVADTVIAYSSVGWIDGPEECFSHPPSIFNKRRYLDEAFKEAGRAPDILGVSKMMTRDKQYKSGVKMGLSFELGTLVYEVKTPTIPLDMVNAPCKTMYITSMDVLCIQLADRSTNLRPGMALLLVNAHLGDLSTNSTCKDLGERDREDPFWRIRVIKAELKIP